MPVPAALLAAIPGIYQTGSGIVQGIRGRKLRNQLKDPGAVVPASVKKATRRSYAMAGANYIDPNETAAIERSTADAVRTARDLGGGRIRNIAGIYESRNRAIAGQHSRARNAYLAANADVIRQLNAEGGYENQAQNYEQQMYRDRLAAASAFAAAGNQNTAGGLDSLAAIGIEGMSGKIGEEATADQRQIPMSSSDDGSIPVRSAASAAAKGVIKSIGSIPRVSGTGNPINPMSGKGAMEGGMDPRLVNALMNLF